jgi:hypothetical protein
MTRTIFARTTPRHPLNLASSNRYVLALFRQEVQIGLKDSGVDFGCSVASVANSENLNEVPRGKIERAPARTGALFVGQVKGGFSDQYLVTGGPQLKR